MADELGRTNEHVPSSRSNPRQSHAGSGVRRPLPFADGVSYVDSAGSFPGRLRAYRHRDNRAWRMGDSHPRNARDGFTGAGLLVRKGPSGSAGLIANSVLGVSVARNYPAAGARGGAAPD